MIGKILIGLFVIGVLGVAVLGLTNTDFSFNINSQDDVPEISISVGDKYLGPVPLGYNVTHFRKTGQLIKGDDR